MYRLQPASFYSIAPKGGSPNLQGGRAGNDFDDLSSDGRLTSSIEIKRQAGNQIARIL